jgi:hypothetical protein
MILHRKTSMKPGSQIQTTSLFSTDHPRELRKDFMLIGETRIGVHGKKYRFDEKGERKATPRPPFVRASRTPWLTQTAKRIEK